MVSLHKEEILELLEFVAATAEKIIKRTSMIESVDDFLLSDAGMEKMDAACMLMQVIGENLKIIDNKTDHKLLSQYPEVSWKGAIGMRDFISHHYIGVDPDIIFITIKQRMPSLLDAVNHIINDLKTEEDK